MNKEPEMAIDLFSFQWFDGGAFGCTDLLRKGSRNFNGQLIGKYTILHVRSVKVVLTCGEDEYSKQE
jgi:hypothetical protein